jgi:hypothetical protein
MLQSLSLTLPLGGCLLTGDKPDPALDIPPSYTYGPRKPGAAEAAGPPIDWWRAFRSRELTEVIEAAREGNLDIAAAVARIVQADANARITGAALLPVVDFNGNALHTQQSKTTGSTNVISVSQSGAGVAIIRNDLRPRSTPATKSIFGARTGRCYRRPKRPQLPAAMIVKWSASQRSWPLPMHISRSLRRKTGCVWPIKTLQAPHVCST